MEYIKRLIDIQVACLFKRDICLTLKLYSYMHDSSGGVPGWRSGGSSPGSGCSSFSLEAQNCNFLKHKL